MRISEARNRTLIISLFLMLPFTVKAQENDHEPLQKSQQMSYAEVFSSALNNTPELLADEVRQDQATAFTKRGKSWIAGRPSLQLSYYDDSPLGNLGMREFEYGVELPLLRWGERQANQSLGKSYQDEAQSWKSWLRLRVAGQVRSVLSDLAEAEAMLALEHTATTSAQELLDITNTLFTAGELSRLDVLQVEYLLLEQKKVELNTEALMVDAERNYAVLTGLRVRPASIYQENMLAQEEISPQHPQLMLIKNAIVLAEANIKKLETESKGSPVLTLGSRRERADQMQSYNDSIGVSISIPFGGKSIVSTKSSTARREKVDVEVLYKNTLRNLNQELHEVEHELFLVGEALLLTSQQNKLSKQRWEMSRSAFSQGELTLAAVVLALQNHQLSQKEEESLLLQKQRLISEFNQIVGVLP